MDDIEQTNASRKIAAFDVDGTLTWTDSFMLFLRFVGGRWGFPIKILGLLPAFLAYLLKLQSRDATKNRLLTAFLAGLEETTYQKLCSDFARIAYPIIARADGLARLNAHLGVRDEVALVSASLVDYLKPWARDLGVSTVLATEVEVIQGALTGRMAGPNCRCEEKVARIRSFYGDGRLVAAYGDSPGDAQMLAAAENPGLLIFDEAPLNKRALWWSLYFGDLLERRLRGETS